MSSVFLDLRFPAVLCSLISASCTAGQQHEKGMGGDEFNEWTQGEERGGSGLCSATREYDDELNDFYCRIDTYDFSTENNSSIKTISISSESQEESLTITQSIHKTTFLSSFNIIALYSNV